MPAIVYNYKNCTGCGECADACMEELLHFAEGGDRWSYPNWDQVENADAKKAYEERVAPSKDPVPIRIFYNVPNCIECLSCVDACSDDAIEIQSDFEGKSVEEI